MEPPSVEEQFPSRIGRTLSLATGALVAAVVLVAVASLVLVTLIQRNDAALMREHEQAMEIARVQDLFDDVFLALALHASSAPATVALSAQEEVLKRLSALSASAREGPAANGPAGQVLGELREIGARTGPLARRVAVGGAPLGPDERQWLERAREDVARHVSSAAAGRRSRVAGLQRENVDRLEAVVALYQGLLVLGLALGFLARQAARSGVALPLRRLGASALEIADGRLHGRLRVRVDNEIGLLAHVFNRMASRLQEADAELRGARDAAEHRVRQTRVLSRLVGLARPQPLGCVLESVVEGARDLLCADAAALCLVSAANGLPVAHATAGPPDAFRAPEESLGAWPVDGREPSGTGSLLQPGWAARAPLAAGIVLADGRRGRVEVGMRDAREWSDEEAALLAALAWLTVAAIENGRLLADARPEAEVESAVPGVRSVY